MTVPRALLAILSQADCYGNQLRAEFARRTGVTLNIGQVYNTLERLERDGQVVRGAADAQGHVFWRITDPGRAEVERWLAAPLARAEVARDDLVVRLGMTASLPGYDLVTVLDALEQAVRARLHSDATEPGVTMIAREAARLSGEADLALLAWFRREVAGRPDSERVIPLSADRPRRGRPLSVSRA